MPYSVVTAQQACSTEMVTVCMEDAGRHQTQLGGFGNAGQTIEGRMILTPRDSHELFVGVRSS